MYDIITIGSAVADVFVSSGKFQLIKSDDFSTGVGECFALGSKINIENIVFDTGGGATNTAVTFRRAGFRVAPICVVGDDMNGEAIVRALQKEDIDTRFVSVHKKEPTGYSVILTAGKGDRTILTYRGAAEKLTAKHIPFSQMQTRWLYISSLSGNVPLLMKILAYAKKHSIKAALNPGGGELRVGLPAMRKVMDMVEVFSVNMEEAAALLGIDYTEKEKVVAQLARIAKNIILITDGKRGAYMIVRGVSYFIPTTKKTVVNATGAGDAFGSGFVSGLMLKDDVHYALRLGLYNSELVVQKVGAKNGLMKQVPKSFSKPRISII